MFDSFFFVSNRNQLRIFVEYVTKKIYSKCKYVSCWHISRKMSRIYNNNCSLFSECQPPNWSEKEIEIKTDTDRVKQIHNFTKYAGSPSISKHQLGYKNICNPPKKLINFPNKLIFGDFEK